MALLAALVWIGWQGAWTKAAWDSPASYSVDALEYLARLKLAEERGVTFLFNETAPRLSAPWSADWSAYPMPDRPINIATGWAARVTGLIVAGNLSLLAAHVLAALAFFLGARALGHRALFAGAGALVFAFSYSIAQRGFSHYSFALAFVVPAMLALTLVAGGARRLLDRRGWQIAGVAVAVLVAVGSPYFGFIFGQLLVFALLARWFFHRGRGACVVALWLVVFLVVFALANVSSLLALATGEGAVEPRGYASTEIYGLRPIEFLIPPPTHRWSVAVELGRHYAAATSLKGELFFPYLGLVGLAGLALLFGAGLRQIARGRLSLRPAYLPLTLWLVALAMVGGAAAVFALGVTDVFRATNRYSIFVLALALFALTSWASRRGGRWPAATAGLTAALVALALWDQLPPRSPDRAQLHAQVEADRAFAAELERALPAGAMVFQLPAVPFLEQPPVGAMTDYELFRPYLHTTTLRFSYGLLASSPHYRWQKNVAQLPPAQMVAALERAGFAALYVRRDAFADRAAMLEAALTAAGRERLLDRGNQLVFRLRPATAPLLPDANDPLHHLNWDGTPPSPAQSAVLLGEGWFQWERDTARAWRWAGADATLFVYHASAQPGTLRLDGELTAIAPTLLTLQLGSTRHEQPLRASQPVTFSVVFPLRPGMNTLQLSADLRSRRAGPNDPRQLGFNLANLRAEFSPSRPE